MNLTFADVGFVGSLDVDVWLYYRAITVSNAGGSAKTNWPVRVPLTSANFDFAHALTTGYDLQFRASNGLTVLSHWREFYDDSTDTAALWVKIPSINAGATVTIRLYYGNLNAEDESDGDAVFPNLFEDFIDPERLTGPLETLVNPQVGNWSRDPTIVGTDAAVSWRTNNLTENSRIIYDPVDLVHPYKYYQTGYSGGSAYKIGLFTSDDGHAWTEYGSNPVITDSTDDLCFIRVGSTIHAFVEYPGTPGASGIVIRRYTSTDDGLTWASQGAAVSQGTAGAWDDDRCGSPCVVPLTGGGFVMVYDGAGTGGGAGQEIGAATATTIAGAWTKVAGNPLLNTGAPTVPLDVWQDESNVWWMLTWASENVSLYTNTVADPTAWVAGDWTATKTNFVNIEGTLALAENSNRSSGIATRIGNAVASNYARRVDFLGNANVTFERTGIALPEPFSSVIEAHSSLLVLDPRGSNTSNSHSVRWACALVNDWAVGIKFKKVAQTAGNFARISVGSGVGASVGGSNHLRQPTNSYGLAFGTEAAADTVLNSVASGTATTQGAAFTVSDFANYHRFELRHTGTTLTYLRDDTDTQTRTITTHDAASKDVMISQGRSSSTLGAISTYDWVYARPYDGVDPTPTVGAEI